MALPAPAEAGWSQPFRFAQPLTLDLLPAQIAFSPGGAALVGFGDQDADSPETSSGQAVMRLQGGELRGPRTVPGARQILDAAFAGSAFEVLVGAANAGVQCCSAAQVLSVSTAGSFGTSQTLVGHLAGAMQGRLVALGAGRMLAAVATGDGVWASQSTGGAEFGPAKRLSAGGIQVEALAASTPGDGRSLVAWTATAGADDGGGSRSISVATGSVGGRLLGRRPVVTVAAGHRIDELALASVPVTGSRNSSVSGRPLGTVSWIESWFDSSGSYQSEPVVADLTPVLRPLPLGVPGEIASGLSFAADGRGDQELAWRECSASGSCDAWVLARRAGGRFGAPVRIGAIDAAQAPVATVAPNGEALVGMISEGHVFVASRGPRASGFGAPQAISPTNFASDLALAFGPTGEAIAAWTQGTLSPSLVGAVYRAS